ncbi:hypothetical protein K443DRAFT_54376, partial [Laccaria amethystina LaAM-08-1]
ISGHGAVAFAKTKSATVLAGNSKLGSTPTRDMCKYLEMTGTGDLFILNALSESATGMLFVFRGTCTSSAILHQDFASSSNPALSSDMVEVHAANVSHLSRCGCSSCVGFDSHSSPYKGLSTLSDSSQWLQ